MHVIDSIPYKKQVNRLKLVIIFSTKKRVRSGENQMEYLVDYMLKHKNFAVGKFQTAQGIP